jgi:type IV pilus assembly protein PilE
MRNSQNGFTLIEVLIVVAIIGILAMIAIPAYQDQVTKARRGDAQAALLSLSNAMERYYTQNNTFAGAALGDGGIFPDESPVDGSSKFYDLSIDAASATGYTIQATPKNNQASDGCLEMTSIGSRTRYAADDCTGTTSNW